MSLNRLAIVNIDVTKRNIVMEFIIHLTVAGETLVAWARL